MLVAASCAAVTPRATGVHVAVVLKCEIGLISRNQNEMRNRPFFFFFFFFFLII